MNRKKYGELANKLYSWTLVRQVATCRFHVCVYRRRSFYRIFNALTRCNLSLGPPTFNSWWNQYVSLVACSAVRLPNIVIGLMSLPGYFFLLSFCQLPSELAEWNSTKLCPTCLEVVRIGKCLSKIWDVASPKNTAQNYLFSTFQLSTFFNNLIFPRFHSLAVIFSGRYIWNKTTDKHVCCPL